MDANEPAAGTSNDPSGAACRRWHMPRTIALIYLAFGALWIFFSDRALVYLQLDAERVRQIQTVNGWFYVVCSGLLVWWLLQRYEQRNRTVMQALLDSQNEVRHANAELEQRVRHRTEQLEAANRELEAFVYAVSHDLRAPLRSMSGFSQILQESAPDTLDDKSRHYLRRIHESSQRMSALIEDLLGLSRISRAELVRRTVDLSQLCADAAAVVRDRYPGRSVTLTIEPGLSVSGDTRLLRIAIENLLDNAWKHTVNSEPARIEVGRQNAEDGGTESAFFVRDNGVGFDMAYAGKLFGPFQRLHAESQFPGTGIGLVTVQRILARHGGRIWAQAAPDRGATFYFTIGADPA